MSQYDDESVIAMNALYLDDTVTVPEIMNNRSKIESDSEKSTTTILNQQQSIKVNLISKNKPLKNTSQQSSNLRAHLMVLPLAIFHRVLGIRVKN